MYPRTINTDTSKDNPMDIISLSELTENKVAYYILLNTREVKNSESNTKSDSNSALSYLFRDKLLRHFSFRYFHREMSSTRIKVCRRIRDCIYTYSSIGNGMQAGNMAVCIENDIYRRYFVSVVDYKKAVICMIKKMEVKVG